MLSGGHSGSQPCLTSLLSAVLGPQGMVPEGGDSLLGVWQSFLRSSQEVAVNGDMSKG